ncbi:MAG: deoxyhypusine synthase [Candidatus Eisenbacteria bacterium]|nr:deoxyhypusine synthase [Candidatus Eisenbacteria bacterium]
MPERSPYLAGQRIAPEPVRPGISVSDLVRRTFLAYNAARLREACRLLSEKMLQDGGTVGLSISGALTPAGIGISCIAPLLRAGHVDWIVTTGANLYHDTHFGLGLSLHQGRPAVDDVALRADRVIRIYDIVFEYDVLLATDRFYQEVVAAPAFQKPMASAEFHHGVGKYLREREKVLGISESCLLAVAFECGVPVYTSSPGDSSIGMTIAASALAGNRLILDPNQDVNETAAIVYEAKRRGTSGVWILGGGSPKNFVLQTEPHLQEILSIADTGHDYFLQVTDARPDTGGLSGATPSEAVSWGKIDPTRLPDAVVAYCDSTIAIPLLTTYVLENVAPRPLKRLYDNREAMLEALRDAHLQTRVTQMLPPGIKPPAKKGPGAS